MGFLNFYAILGILLVVVIVLKSESLGSFYRITSLALLTLVLLYNEKPQWFMQVLWEAEALVNKMRN